MSVVPRRRELIGADLLWVGLGSGAARGHELGVGGAGTVGTGLGAASVEGSGGSLRGGVLCRAMKECLQGREPALRQRLLAVVHDRALDRVERKRAANLELMG